MAGAVEEFRFKLAKAKDLPPSWFELVLAPRKFQEHVKALNNNKKCTLTSCGHYYYYFLINSRAICSLPDCSIP